MPTQRSNSEECNALVTVVRLLRGEEEVMMGEDGDEEERIGGEDESSTSI